MDDLTLSLLLFLFTKHFIVDFLLQWPYQYKNKGTYGHPGGILHAGLHGIPTAMILGPVYGLVDVLVHYHVDWAKMKINERKGWRPTTHEQFWHLLGFDQFLHTLTYLLLCDAYMRYS